MTATTTDTIITFEDYAGARNALEALGRERAAVLTRGLEALRRWLAAGAGERWLHYEAVVQKARAEDLALAMWFEHQWRRERFERRRAAEKERRAAEAPAAAPVNGPVSGHTRTAAPPANVAPGRPQRPASRPPRSFSPRGPAWRK